MEEDKFIQHANEFLNYVVTNEKKLKKNLKKNITFKEEIFDDVWQDTIVKIYDYIIKNEKIIEKFEPFIFICSKNNYILADNKYKKKLNNDRRDFYTNCENGREMAECNQDVKIYYNLTEEQDFNKEQYLSNINTLFKFIYQRVEEVFGSKEADIYIIYHKLKSENRISYSKLASIFQTNVNYIRVTIKKIKEFVREDKIILKQKERLVEDYD